MKFLNLGELIAGRIGRRFVPERTSRYVPHVGQREKARRLKQLADQQARILAKLESRG